MFSTFLISSVLGLSQFAYGSSEGKGKTITIVDPSWHGKCVDWVNAMRSREGLPVLQRWTDFERCGDAAAKRDAKRDIVGWSISQQIFCDWEPYRPTHQVTCRYGRGESAFEECANRMWQEKQELTMNSQGDLVCKDGRVVEECADGYLQMRGGLKGYNIYDRVACGIHQLKNGNMWISYIFGRGEKVTQPKQLKKASNWNFAPINWDRNNYQRYGFVCGGNKSVHPNGLLTADCENYDRSQYDDCSSTDMDYLLAAGCVVPTFSPSLSPSRSPSSSPTRSPSMSPTYSPTFIPTSGPTPKPTMSAEEVACLAANTKKECKRTPGCAFHKDRTCRLMMGTCYGVVSKRMCKFAEPCRWMAESDMCIAREDSNSDKVCSDITSGNKCRKFGCHFENGLCRPYDGVCNNVTSRKSCQSFGCVWKKNACIEKHN